MTDTSDENGATTNWEVALIIAVEKAMVQLRWLIRHEHLETQSVQKQDVHDQVCRLSALTDLARPGGLPVSETTAVKLQLHKATAMQWVREGGACL